MKVTLLKPSDLGPGELEAWSELRSRDQRFDSPCFSSGFTLAVAQARDDIEVAILEADGAIRGVFPFHRVRRETAHPVGEILSEMHGIIAEPGLDWDPLALIRQCGLESWKFDHLLASQEQFQPFHRAIDDSAYMDISGGYDAYLAERRAAGSSVARNAARKARKMEREIGPLRFELHDEAAGTLLQLIALKKEQLRLQGFSDMFRQPWIGNLMEIVNRTETAGFSGLLSSLYAGDRLTAIVLNLRSGPVLASWIPSFDPAFSRYSPGLVLHLKLAEAASRQGITRIDLGRGENQMKTSLRSAGIPLALGAVEIGFVRRELTNAWYRARAIAHHPVFSGWPRRTATRLKNALKPVET
ncbi:MAG: GNAT family N-acetyltransferase [Pseudomonadota bacterium]